MAITPLPASATDWQKSLKINPSFKNYLTGSRPLFGENGKIATNASEYNKLLVSKTALASLLKIQAEKHNNIFESGKLLGMDMSTWGLLADIGRSILPESSMYSGKEGNLARGLDSAYDTASNAIAAVPGWGTAASAIMKAGALVNQGINALGGGTDGMTKTDAILNSNFLGLTPIGLINGLGGSRADKYSRDMLVDAETNGSYGGFLNLEDESDKVSGKKYGLFSQGAKNDANDLVLKTTAQKISLGNIEDTNRLNLQAALGNTPFIANRLLTDYSGGIRQLLVGKEGLRFAKRVVSKSRVKKVIDESTNKAVTIPTDLTDDLKMGRKPITTSEGKIVYMTGDGNVISKIKKAKEGIKLDDLVKIANDKNPRFIQRLKELPRGIEFINDNGEESTGSHYLSYDEVDGKFIVYPRILEIEDGTLKFFNSKDALDRALENDNYLEFSSEKEAYDFSTNYKKFYPEFFNNWENSYIENKGLLNSYKEGGKVNVIPEGALHAHKHHLDEIDEKFEDVTTKGIPVVSEDKDGGLVLLAEVEKEEIIFRLEVTKKLEELKKEGTDEAAIEAGKLLAHEILHNTVDNTDLIEKTN